MNGYAVHFYSATHPCGGKKLPRNAPCKQAPLPRRKKKKTRGTKAPQKQKTHAPLPRRKNKKTCGTKTPQKHTRRYRVAKEKKHAVRYVKCKIKLGLLRCCSQ
jgi:hypothetical protein